MSARADGPSIVGGLVDLAFFVVVAMLGWRHSLTEGTIAALLLAYAHGRFGVAKDKAQARRERGSDDGSSGPPSEPPAGPREGGQDASAEDRPPRAPPESPGRYRGPGGPRRVALAQWALQSGSPLVVALVGVAARLHS